MAKLQFQFQRKYRKRKINYGKISIAIATKIQKKEHQMWQNFHCNCNKNTEKENRVWQNFHCNCNKNTEKGTSSMAKFPLQLQQNN